MKTNYTNSVFYIKLKMIFQIIFSKRILLVASNDKSHQIKNIDILRSDFNRANQINLGYLLVDLCPQKKAFDKELDGILDQVL